MFRQHSLFYAEREFLTIKYLCLAHYHRVCWVFLFFEVVLHSAMGLPQQLNQTRPFIIIQQDVQAISYCTLKTSKLLVQQGAYV